MRKESQNWFYVAIGGVLISVLSLFVSVIIYSLHGRVYNYNIASIVNGDATRELDLQYKGPTIMNLTGEMGTFLGILVLLSILCSVIGLVTLRAQRPNTWQFWMTIGGLIGVSIPSIIVIIVVLFYGKYYAGKIYIGAAPVITPIAMVLCIRAVMRRKNKIQEELQKELIGKGLIQKAGDL